MHEKPLTISFPPHSFLEYMEPRLKIVALLWWVILVVSVSTGDPHQLGYFGLSAGLLLLLNHRLLGKFLMRWLPSVLMILPLCIFLLFLQQGRTLVQFGPFTITEQGWTIALHLFSTALLCMAGVALCWASSSEADLLCALQGLGMPRPLVAVFGFMLRYLHVLRPELHRLSDARLARQIGHHTPGALRIPAQLIGALFLRSHQRAEHVAEAMAARGHDGQWRNLIHYHWHGRDLLALLLFFSITLIIRWI
ncbi:MAG: Energy-coupling factor transporter transmembrane protein EcfT [Phycisphaerae bacterium]|nr:Energy-coupling factor transporter transmembrane protein EcfT [Phycisphaerae bacterium]